MKILIESFLKTTGLLVLLGYAALQGARAESASAGPNVGYLRVFSATEQSQWGEGSYYYLHTGYRILDANSKEVKWIENHNSSIDEAPQTVELVPGSYTISAQSDKGGLVKVPVVIRVARTTAVHLENDRGSKKEAVSSARPGKTLSGPAVVMSN